MVKQRLLNKALEHYSRVDSNVKMSRVSYSKYLINQLFETFNTYGMVECSFCCYGLEKSCWSEIVEEGIWDLTLDQVRSNILNRLNQNKRHLYNSNRVYLYRSVDLCYLYVYLRDINGEDYAIWFANDNLEK